MSDPGRLNSFELQRALLARADSLRKYVAGRIPERLAGVVSPDDVLQETWIAAFSHVETFVSSGPQALDRWLITIANRKLIDALKSAHCRKRGAGRPALTAVERTTSSPGAWVERLAEDAVTPSRDVATREAARAVQRALRGLPEERREVVQLRFVEGLSPRQITLRLGKSYAAVNSLLFHALRDLRRRLGQANRFFSDARSTDGSQH